MLEKDYGLAGQPKAAENRRIEEAEAVTP